MKPALFLILALTGCTAATNPPGPSTGSPPEPAIRGFDAAAIRAAVETDAVARLGAEAVRLAAAAPTSILATHHQGLPRPLQNADGSWGYEPPGANAMIRTTTGWAGWVGSERRAVSPAKAAEIERILADASFWAEPDLIPPTCTDAGARRLVVRHRGRTTVRQQSCGGVGLTGRLWELVYGGPN